MADPELTENQEALMKASKESATDNSRTWIQKIVDLATGQFHKNPYPPQIPINPAPLNPEPASESAKPTSQPEQQPISLQQPTQPRRAA